MLTITHLSQKAVSHAEQKAYYTIWDRLERYVVSYRKENAYNSSPDNVATNVADHGYGK